MQVFLSDGVLRVEASRLELLKFTTRLRKELGSQIHQLSPESITFSAELLGRVYHLFDHIENLEPEFSQRAESHRRHNEARIEVVRRLNETPSLPEPWSTILETAQASAVNAMVTPGLNGLCLFDEQGSGKTVMTLAAFDILRQNKMIDAMIVVCPKSMVGEWPKDARRFPVEFSVKVAEGNMSARFNVALQKFDILVTNYEGVGAISGALAATGRARSLLLTVDESYMVKNNNSVRSIELRNLRKACKKCFVLCGTPAPNSPYDLVNQFDLADEGFTFGGFNKTNNEALDRNRIEDLIETRGTFIRRLKTEILTKVPDKYFHLVGVKMQGRQRVLYEKARNELILELRHLDNSRFKKYLAIYFQRRSALLQICANPSAVDPTYAETPVKYNELDRLITELTDHGKKVLIWSFYSKSIDELMSRYAKLAPIRIDGSVTKGRMEAVQIFQDDPSRLVFIGNPAAAGAGITLHAAHNAIYVSYSNQAAYYLQSLDRIHRRGQKSPSVDYYLLYCEGTIEETEISRLRAKEIQQHSLLGDQVAWPTSLDQALAELGHHT